MDTREGICSVQVKQNGKFIDWGDFPCVIFFKKNSDELQWMEVKNIDSKVSKGDRVIFERSAYNISNKIDGKLKVEKDDMETSLLKFEDMGVPIQKGIKVPISQGLSREETRFMDNWTPVWVRNIAKNYDRICQGETIMAIKGKCEKSPAIIVGAGPSLDKNIDELKDINAVIIATDRAYKPLLARGINPNLIVSLDCHDNLVLQYLNKVDSSKHILVMNTAEDYNIARMWQGRILYYNMAHKGMLFCDRTLPLVFQGFPGVANVGCVVNTALIIADWIKCKPLILVGCDFSYPDGKMGCDTYDYINGAFQKVEIDEKKLFEERTGKIERKGIYTYLPFLDYLETLNQLKESLKCNIVNATEGGIIDCFPCLTLQEAKRKYCNRNVDKIKNNLNRR